MPSEPPCVHRAFVRLKNDDDFRGRQTLRELVLNAKAFFEDSELANQWAPKHSAERGTQPNALAGHFFSQMLWLRSVVRKLMDAELFLCGIVIDPVSSLLQRPGLYPFTRRTMGARSQR